MPLAPEVQGSSQTLHREDGKGPPSRARHLGGAGLSQHTRGPCCQQGHNTSSKPSPDIKKSSMQSQTWTQQTDMKKGWPTFWRGSGRKPEAGAMWGLGKPVGAFLAVPSTLWPKTQPHPDLLCDFGNTSASLRTPSADKESAPSQGPCGLPRERIG